MKMKLFWTKKARAEMLKIARYIRKNFGEIAWQNFMDEVAQTSSCLEHMPNIGKVEPYLEDLPDIYRSIVVTKNKIVYHLEADTVVIDDFWDARQNPENLANRVVS